MTVGTVAQDAGQLFQEHLCSAGESLVHVGIHRLYRVKVQARGEDYWQNLDATWSSGYLE